jgi:cytochrome c oxidase subunit II
MHVSVFNPASPQAAELLWLWNVCMWVCGFILAAVTLSILYIVVRYRRHGENEPPQIAGNKRLEIVWTIIPLALVGFLFVLTIRTARAVDHHVNREPDVVVTGHQWWWEVAYPAANAITANEIHLPVGREMLIGIEAADVIHDFWVPRLGRKIDAIPGRRNFVWIRAEQPGDYQGACAEYCGAQHAWMRFRVVAQLPAAYDSWLTAQAAAAITPAGGDAKLGQTRFGELTCANCHNIRGINKQKQYGPDLTHIASRKMLAAERLENTPENLKNWLRQPNIIKPNCEMPDLKLSDSDLTALTALLESLK